MALRNAEQCLEKQNGRQVNLNVSQKPRPPVHRARGASAGSLSTSETWPVQAASRGNSAGPKVFRLLSFSSFSSFRLFRLFVSCRRRVAWRWIGSDGSEVFGQGWSQREAESDAVVCVLLGASVGAGRRLGKRVAGSGYRGPPKLMALSSRSWRGCVGDFESAIRSSKFGVVFELEGVGKSVVGPRLTLHWTNGKAWDGSDAVSSCVFEFRVDCCLERRSSCSESAGIDRSVERRFRGSAPRGRTVGPRATKFFRGARVDVLHPLLASDGSAFRCFLGLSMYFRRLEVVVHFFL